MKKLSLLFLAFILVCHSPAQTPAESKHELYTGYGFLPSTELLDIFSDFLTSFVTLTAYHTKNTRSIGTINAGYAYKIKNWLGVGVTYTYSDLSKDLFNFHDKKYGEEYHTYHTIMPMVKFNWLRKKWITLYSKVNTGVVFFSNKINMTDPEAEDYRSHEVRFAFQVSPLGIEIGKSFSGFTEYGFGNSGLLQLGVRCRF